MRLAWASAVWGDYVEWSRTEARVHSRINDLVKEARPTPFQVSISTITGTWSEGFGSQPRASRRMR